jgi:hypothetical protein
MYQLAPPICKVLPPVVSTICAASSTSMFIDGNFKDTMIDTYRSLINMTDQSVIISKYGFYFLYTKITMHCSG